MEIDFTVFGMNALTHFFAVGLRAAPRQRCVTLAFGIQAFVGEAAAFLQTCRIRGLRTFTLAV